MNKHRKGTKKKLCHKAFCKKNHQNKIGQSKDSGIHM